MRRILLGPFLYLYQAPPHVTVHRPPSCDALELSCRGHTESCFFNLRSLTPGRAGANASRGQKAGAVLRPSIYELGGVVGSQNTYMCFLFVPKLQKQALVYYFFPAGVSTVIETLAQPPCAKLGDSWVELWVLECDLTLDNTGLGCLCNVDGGRGRHRREVGAGRVHRSGGQPTDLAPSSMNGQKEK